MFVCNADTDQLGFALHLSSYQIPDNIAAVRQLVDTLSNILDPGFVFSLLKSGLLRRRSSISRTQWMRICHYFKSSVPTKQVIQPKMVQKGEKQTYIYRPFCDQVLPSDLLQSIFTYLDAVSQASINDGTIFLYSCA